MFKSVSFELWTSLDVKVCRTALTTTTVAPVQNLLNAPQPSRVFRSPGCRLGGLGVGEVGGVGGVGGGV